MKTIEVQIPLFLQKITEETLLRAYNKRKEQLQGNIPITLRDDLDEPSIDPSKILGVVKEMKLENGNLVGVCEFLEDSSNVNVNRTLKLINWGSPICIVPHALGIIKTNDDKYDDVKLIDFGLAIHNFSDRKLKICHKTE